MAVMITRRQIDSGGSPPRAAPPRPAPPKSPPPKAPAKAPAVGLAPAAAKAPQTGGTQATYSPAKVVGSGGGTSPIVTKGTQPTPPGTKAIIAVASASSNPEKAVKVLYADVKAKDLKDERRMVANRTGTARSGGKPQIRYQTALTQTPTRSPNGPRAIGFDEFMEEMPYIQGIPERRYPIGDPRTGRDLDSSRAGTAQRAVWANRTLRRLSDRLGGTPTYEEIFAATWDAEAGGDWDQVACIRRGLNARGQLVCLETYPDNRQFGTAIEQQLAAYMVGFCGSNGCNDIELATLLGHFQAWSNVSVSVLEETINAIRADDPRFQRAAEAGGAIIDNYNTWREDGVPAGTPYRYSGGVDIRPGYTTFCDPINEPC